jgi:acyl carrier protein
MRTEFLQAMGDALQLDAVEVDEATELAWDSLLIVATMSMISEYYDRTVEIDALLQCGTVGQLLALIEASDDVRRAA